MVSLPGIRHIYSVPITYLVPNITYRALASMSVPVYIPPSSRLKFYGDAVCDVTSADDNNTRIEKVTLTFHTAKTVPTTPVAFVIRTVPGDTYIIGTKEAPYPVVKVETTTGSPDGDAALSKVQVTFSARKALVKCIY